LVLDSFKLNDRQREAAEATEGAVLVLAGAGSGKTRVLTARVAHLIECGVAPGEILAITFTNKAAGEMKERINAAIGGECAVWTSTFHSFCAKILRFDGHTVGFNSDFSIYDEADSERVLKRLFERRSVTEKGVIADVKYQIKWAKSMGYTPEEYLGRAMLRGEKNAALARDIYEAYKAELKTANALDFDDLMNLALEMLREVPSVLSKWQRRFRYILVDEFQDTSRTQYELLKLLSGGYGNLFAVGDEDQSIYSWRGADLKNILEFQKDFPEAKLIKLEQNYRSTQNILDAANAVIKCNASRFGKKLWTNIAAGDKIEVYRAASDRDEVDFVVRSISRLVGEGYKFSDIAILMRTNAQSLNFETAFNLNSLPYKVFGGFKFFERKEIKDVVAYLRAAVNPSDTESILRIINFPRRGIGDTTVAALSYQASVRGGILKALAAEESLPKLAAQKLAAFRKLLAELIAAAAEKSPAEFVKFVLERAGIKNYYMGLSDPAERDRYENIEEFLNSVYEFERDNPEGTISEFLQSVALISDTDEITDGNYLTVATVHAVKGLEFSAVFITGLEENIFPSARAIAESNIEEERRLMYVAMTRAKRRLYLSHAQSRFRFGKSEFNLRSRFLAEMGCPETAEYKPRGYEGAIRREVLDWNRGKGDGWGKSAPSAPASAPSKAPQRKPFEEAEVDYKSFSEGREVYHDKFGRGIIIKASGEGQNTMLDIAFQGLGVKRFFLLMAASHMKLI